MASSQAPPARPAYEFPRDAILIALAAAAGAVDVISLLGLGGVFTANMSGNLVFFSLAIGNGVTSVAFRSLAAFLLAHARALAPLVPAGLICGAVGAARAWQRPGGVLAS